MVWCSDSGICCVLSVYLFLFYLVVNLPGLKLQTLLLLHYAAADICTLVSSISAAVMQPTFVNCICQYLYFIITFKANLS